MNADLPQFCFLGWQALPRILPSGIGNVTKRYSVCIFSFLKGADQRLYGEHEVVLLDKMIRFYFLRAPNLVDSFSRECVRELQKRSNRVLAFATQDRMLGEGQPYKVNLPGQSYHFLESHTRKVAVSLLSYARCNVSPLKQYKQMNRDELSVEAHAAIEASQF